MARGKLLALVGLVGLAALTGCSGFNCIEDSGAKFGPSVVLQRGHAGRQPWQLVAWSQAGRLWLVVDGSSQKDSYAGGTGFCSGPGAWYYQEGPGPGDSYFYFGPTPADAAYAVFTVHGHASFKVATRPIPDKGGLPAGRFFIVDPPGGESLDWDVTLKDTAGETVPFANF